MRALSAVAAALLFLAFSPVFAAGYRVDSSGGPLTLSDDVAAALLEWSQQIPGADLTEGAPGDIEVRYAAGEPGGAGPDTVTLTLQDSAGPEHLTILVNALLFRDYPAALVHEAGIMLGASPATTGIMNPALSSATPTGPQESDLLLLRQAQERIPGDLTGDGMVDWLDLLQLAAVYGQRGVNLPSDLDGDGVITDADLELLRGLYEFREPQETSPTAPVAPASAAD